MLNCDTLRLFFLYVNQYITVEHFDRLKYLNLDTSMVSKNLMI